MNTAGVESTLAIPPKTQGSGSSVNGGELLFLALATCYCNDIYREAAKRGIAVDGVDVSVSGDFDDAGTARGVTYRAKIASKSDRNAVLELARHVDEIAEIHRALRGGTRVEFAGAEIVAEASPQERP
ncbi:MAG TPA: OsmC family protein [Candidatus Acidoferrales bacterium]|nr:OsmC family protein [Candidatus Acidoferrales bacterium]